MIAVLSVRRTAWLLSVLALAGCQLYWTKPGGYLGNFSSDHTACVTASGRPMPGDDRVLVNLDLYRACLKAKDWQRVTGAKAGVPIGYFRGQENEGPIRPNDLPAQPHVVPSPPRGQRGSSGPNFGPR